MKELRDLNDLTIHHVQPICLEESGLMFMGLNQTGLMLMELVLVGLTLMGMQVKAGKGNSNSHGARPVHSNHHVHLVDLDE